MFWLNIAINFSLLRWPSFTCHSCNVLSSFSNFRATKGLHGCALTALHNTCRFLTVLCCT
ncbi:hypothetical protein PF005_g13572 [Phytophthora fragariae]|uniref:BED-type domain-containing protein n=1 Tax=Phytophthora fragariae TaxID=53985 RepID=A0A6A3TS26_9STRA|nr:hypothetical protein PF003_g2542 [Phytophthora fragariae]KAE8937211.1 hypothetical protein PF009_g12884 [Phytophthora fragariae]KAE9000212.1 hypothetical protein PF011_g14284 [Phytophthora fragariae]KAE9104861.1 hypothetical protein PF010_g13228 [Phytophthora fragariae]KAE9105078.1 hypothetical protein PF007_g13828 [Phytophthora fragariae]